MVWFFLVSSPKTRFCAIAVMAPVPGVSTTIASPTRSVVFTIETAAVWAAACWVGTSVVRIVRPPFSNVATRSASVAPRAGSEVSSFDTQSQK